MEADGRVHSVQELRASPAEGDGEGARPQKTRKRRSWTAEEDAVLAADVRAHGVGKWDAVPKRTGLARTGQSCRYRWFNSLLPSLKDVGVAFSRDEELHLCRLHAALGNKWSRIAAEMEGRSENEVMHYWFSHVSRCQQSGLNVYPQEVQAVAGQSDLHQPQLKKHQSQTSSLPQQPPPPPYLLPHSYPNYPVVPTHLPQPLGAVYPVTIAIAPPPPLPVMAEASSTSQFWASLLSFSNQTVEQGMQSHQLALPLGNTTEFNENGQRLPSLLALLNQNVEQGRHTQPPALPLRDATKFNEENQLIASLLPQSNQNVEQEMQPQRPALPLVNATEFNEEDQLLTYQNVERWWQPPPPALPLESATKFNEEDQHLASLVPLSDQNGEPERQLQSPAIPLGNVTEFNDKDNP